MTENDAVVTAMAASAADGGRASDEIPASAAEPPSPPAPPVQPPPEEQPPQTAASGPEPLDPQLAELARWYGYDLSGDPSGTGLARALALHFDRQLSELGRQVLYAPPPPRAPSPPVMGDPRPLTPPPPAQGPGGGVDFRKLIPDLNPEEIDEKLVKAFSALRDGLTQYDQGLAGRLAELEQKLAAAEEFRQRSQQERFQQEANSFFDSLGPEWEQEFGKGDRVNSQQYRNRNNVLDEYTVLMAGHLSMGLAPPPNAVALRRALFARYGDQQQDLARRKLLQEAKTLRQQAAPAASGKASEPAAGRERAERIWEEGLKQLSKTLGFRLPD